MGRHAQQDEVVAAVLAELQSQTPALVALVAAEVEAGEHPDKPSHLTLGLADAAHTHDVSGLAPVVHTHDYAASGHTHSYAAIAHTHVGLMTMLRKADGPQANSTTTPADITQMSFALAAAEVKYFRGNVFFTTAAAATGLGLGANAPAGATILARILIPTTATAVFMGVLSSLDGNVQGTASLGATSLAAEIEGVVVNGANAGNFSLRFRSETGGSAVNVLNNSTLAHWS